MTFGTNPEWWQWVIVVALFIWVVYLDIQSRRSKLRWGRLLALFLGFLALIGLYLKPSMSTLSITDQVVIVTPASDEEVLDSLREENYQFYDFDEFMLEKPTVNSVMVVGSGLQSFELEQLGQPLRFIPNSSVIEGPIEYDFEQVIANAESNLRIRFELLEEVKIIFSGIGITSQERSADPSSSTLDFTFTPNVPGDHLFQVIGVRERDTIFSEQIPMKIQKPSKDNVLILTGAPSFEIRFLKNHLAENGLGVAERQQVSKDIYRTAFSNLENRSLRSLTDDLLEDFKLVVIDETAYESLTWSEKANLKSALTTGQVGLIWIGVESEFMDLQRAKTETLSFESETGLVELKQAGFNVSDPHSVIKYQGHRIGAIGSFGLGKITVPELSSIYTLKLKGEEKLFSEIWYLLLDPSFGFSWEPDKVEFASIPVIQEPATLRLENPARSVLIDSIRVATEELWYRPGYYETRFWPKRSGWHEVSWNDFTESFYVFDRDDWNAKRRLESIQRTSLYAKSTSTGAVKESVFKPINKWVFYFVFLSAFGFLWIEQRLG